ncbi:potassium-transporting ATPase subunit KdpC [Variovorax sp. OV329]|uniref:potassium-transporting ATPase subunit KdpC n=1 Tax=Variovorax sp. OV329 TaxID=1882825 RepID=UPI0008EA449F|nr:potassium-transporting ATPase subunit KdpC [Variovorax sp. OV329]SFN28278.1 K+-transporting ATPase ATPase C chain [Variovorax sp. OV329]
MNNILRPALVLFVLLSAITGIVYPLAVTGVAQSAFAEKANGSLLRNTEGQAVGSVLIGQAFADPKNFWGRPSATADKPYNGLASGGSNLGPLNPALRDAVAQRVAALREADPASREVPVPIDLVTASGSGLDPHISPEAARYQLPRVAKARGLQPQVLEALIDQHTDWPWLGFLGEPRVNVLELNLALNGPPMP